MKGRAWGVSAVALVAFTSGAIAATVVLIGPFGLRPPSREPAIAGATSTPIATPQVASPSPATGASLAFDEARSKVVAFDHSGETWTWDGRYWTRQHPAQSPPARESAAMTYDPNNRLVLLWGGFANQIWSADLWSWDGTNWASIHAANSPPANGTLGWARPAPVLAYDSQRHLVVLVRNNGLHPAGPTGPDVWTWDGSAWTHANNSNVPPIWGSAAYVPSVNGILFFGVDGNASPQMWTFSADRWTKLTSVLAPAVAPDDPPPMAYFGPAGTAELVDGAAQVWSWQGGGWSRIAGSALSTAVGRTYSIVFDSARGQLVLLAAATYVWNGKNWARPS